MQVFDPRFFPSDFWPDGARVSRFGHESRGKKNPVRNLHYGPRTQL